MTTLNLATLTEEQKVAFVEGWENAGGFMGDLDTPHAAPGTGPTKSKSKARPSKKWEPTGGARTRPKSKP